MMIAIPGMNLVAVLLLGSLAAMVYGLVYAIAYRRPGVGFVAMSPLVILTGLIVTKLFAVWTAQQPVTVAQHQALAAHEMAEQARIRLEEAQLKAFEVQQEAEAMKEGQIHELWEQLNQPRIKLKTDEQGASMAMGDGPNRVELHAGTKDGAKLVAPLPDEAAESLSRSITRLERMVRQVSAVADQFSDAGTLIGKAMVALGDSIDPQVHPAQEKQTEIVAAKPTAIVAAEPAQTVVEAAPAKVAVESTATYSSLAQIPHSSSDASEDPSRASVRPEWINEPPRRIAGKWRQVIASDEFVTDEECYSDADARIRAATEEHLKHLVQGELNRANVHLPALDEIGVGIEFIRREIATEEYFETVERSFGPMRKLYTQIEFSPSVDGQLREKWNEFRRQDRMTMVGVGAGSVLSLLGLAFGLLKVDTWTKGYYSKRLFLGVPTAIIGLLALLWTVVGP